MNATPIRMSAKDVKKLRKNMNTPDGHSKSNTDISTLLTALWDAWELGKGRRRTIEDVNKHKAELLHIARKYTKKGQQK